MGCLGGSRNGLCAEYTRLDGYVPLKKPPPPHLNGDSDIDVKV